MNELLLRVLTMPMDELRARLSMWREICWMAEIQDDAKDAEILGDAGVVYPMRQSSVTFQHLPLRAQGNVIYPNAFTAGSDDTKARDEEIRKLHAGGLPVSEIARKYGLSYSTVNKIIANGAV